MDRCAHHQLGHQQKPDFHCCCDPYLCVLLEILTQPHNSNLPGCRCYRVFGAELHQPRWVAQLLPLLLPLQHDGLLFVASFRPHARYDAMVTGMRLVLCMSCTTHGALLSCGAPQLRHKPGPLVKHGVAQHPCKPSHCLHPWSRCTLLLRTVGRIPHRVHVMEGYISIIAVVIVMVLTCTRPTWTVHAWPVHKQPLQITDLQQCGAVGSCR